MDFVNPENILNQIALKKDNVAVDFGSGSGGWALPLAKKLEDGTVFAVDVQEEPLSALQGKARAENIKNIETILADVEKPITQLGDETCDIVLMTNILFEVEDVKAVFEQAKRVLKPGGNLLVVEWKKDSPFGPRQGRIEIQEVEKAAQGFSFKLEKELETGDYHYGILFEKI